MSPSWLHVTRADTPLILAMPHGGTLLPLGSYRSGWWARRDTDWYISDVYAGLANATVVATDISRSVIDVNRDPSGTSLYPGQVTTELCPTTSFDGDPLYDKEAPDEAEIADRRVTYFEPYHASLSAEIARLRDQHLQVIVFDCHSIRSRIPRLFDDELPELNIGTNGGTSCAHELRDSVAAIAGKSGRSYVVDGRFRGGWTTRRLGRPDEGVHAIQLEIAMRAYLREPSGYVTEANWPPRYDPAFAAPLRETLADMLATCMDFAR